MAYKQFSLNIIFRVFTLCVTIFLIFYLIFKTSLYATTFILGIIIILQIYFLIRFVSKTNKEIIKFFESIKYSDFSQSFSARIKGASFEELSSSFSEVMKKFQNTRAEKEENFRYLQTVVQHIGIGLMAFTPDGEVELINTSAKRLLNITTIKNLKELNNLSPTLPSSLLELNSGDKILQKIVEDNELIQLAISATEFRMRGKKIILISLQNIQSELEDIEIEAWQKLIKVLTHEIMNSVTPITSLASTADGILQEFENNSSELDESLKENLMDVRGAVGTIQKRSKGLLHFVDAYRNLTKVPIPNFAILQVGKLFKRIESLLSDQFRKINLKFKISVEPENLEIMADSDLIEQVLINLIVNSMYALEGKDDPQVTLYGRIDDHGRGIIQVKDNGPGLTDDIAEKMFIPFFTTRKGGSGIGLSLSQQIMRAHRGSIRVNSIPDKETVFTLRF
ncbi:MAG TPA: ATP-binding protein [Ignavibacteriaceae bacterium]|nr:ATP-binding protein [Ignavibacteriaceae bacterium]